MPESSLTPLGCLSATAVILLRNTMWGAGRGYLPAAAASLSLRGESFISTPLCHVAKCISFVMRAGVTKVEMFLLI